MSRVFDPCVLFSDLTSSNAIRASFWRFEIAQFVGVAIGAVVFDVLLGLMMKTHLCSAVLTSVPGEMTRIEVSRLNDGWRAGKPNYHDEFYLALKQVALIQGLPNLTSGQHVYLRVLHGMKALEKVGLCPFLSQILEPTLISSYHQSPVASLYNCQRPLQRFAIDVRLGLIQPFITRSQQDPDVIFVSQWRTELDARRQIGWWLHKSLFSSLQPPRPVFDLLVS